MSDVIAGGGSFRVLARIFDRHNSGWVNKLPADPAHRNICFKVAVPYPSKCRNANR
ncbi:MAG: hypothetical protein IK013_01370 [Bacteroidales bacterium]|nr:hypothetical protein [Bacteroidales bacterium]